MKSFKKILFPLDLSEISPIIVPYVKNVAETYGAEVHMLFVARVFDYFKGIYVSHPSIDQFESEVIAGAQKKLREFHEEFFADGTLTVKTAVVPGDIAEEILKYIAKEDIDLLVMGTHGRRGFEKVVFGSVAERMIKLAPVPLLLINPFKVKDGLKETPEV